MSLPDTVFIFVLALIIFGPKKLPEIGRQLGRLVGEFRRASNEFKYQIEEELRQVDFDDKRSRQQSIAAPSEDTSQITNTSVDESYPNDPAENIPVGQHPNIDNLNASELNPLETSYADRSDFDWETEPGKSANANQDAESLPASAEAAAELTITPATDIEPRVTAPRATAPLATEIATAGDNPSVPFPLDTDDASVAATNHSAPAGSYPVSSEAEITHG